MEPLMAISTYCRECGEYFRIKKGKPLVKAGPRISGISEISGYGSSSLEDDLEENDIPADEEIDPEKEESATVDTWLRSPGGKNQHKARPLVPAPADETNGIEDGAGAFFGLAEDTKNAPSSKEATKPADEEASLGIAATPAKELAQGTMSALIGDIVESNEFGADSSRMPANFIPPEEVAVRKKKNKKEIEVRCFRCNHRQNVSLYAASTQCGRCSVYITMSDYEIKGVRKNVLRTRGNVIVTRRGSVIDTELDCHNFTAYGLVSAQLDCTGDVTFKHSGKISGQIHCRHLIVAKKCEVEFLDGVIAKRADIYGAAKGNVTCSDTITVYKTGTIKGDARAEQVEVKSGGSISGETSLEQEIDVSLPIKAGFNPSIIG